MVASIRMLCTLLGLFLCLERTHAAFGIDFLFSIDYDGEATATKARNIRAAIRYHWAAANRAQNMMLKAENDDDVDGYEHWEAIMRQEDAIWEAKEAEYNQLRDILEAKIRTGELKIRGFTHKYEKSTFASIVDHLTLRAKH